MGGGIEGGGASFGSHQDIHHPLEFFAVQEAGLVEDADVEVVFAGHVPPVLGDPFEVGGGDDGDVGVVFLALLFAVMSKIDRGMRIGPSFRDLLRTSVGYPVED